MDDATAVLAGHTKKYNIPLSHFEYKYIQNCTDGKELERIYKELIGGEVGAFPDLERLTLDRIRDVKPNSQVLRQDKAPLDKTALPDDERQGLDEFLNEMKQKTKTSSIIRQDHPNNNLDSVPIRTKSIVSKSITPNQSASVINTNGKAKRIVPRSYEEWGKLDKKLAREINSDNDEDDHDEDDDEEESSTKKQEEKPTNKLRPPDQTHEKSQRLQMAEQHRLNGNTAFKSNNYQQSIDSYTKSLMLDNTNSVVYMNRAIAYFKLNNYDSSITDCSQVLSTDPRHIKALYRRASCHIAKQQYDEARHDLDTLLTVDPENADGKNLLETIPQTVQKPKGVRIPITEDEDEDDNQPTNNQSSNSAQVKIPIVEVEEEEEEEEPFQQEQVINESNPSMNIDIPQRANIHTRPGIDSQEASPAMFDSHFHHHDDRTHSSFLPPNPQYHRDNVDDDDDVDDDMALGDEAGADLIGNMSDDDGNGPHSINVSPTMDDDDDDDGAPELVDHKPLETPPSTPTKRQSEINQHIVYTIDENSPQKDLSSRKTNENLSQQQQRSSTTNIQNDYISNSNFSSTIQNWLRDLAILQSNRRSSSIHDKLWSRSARPWSLDKLQRDIERYHRLNDFRLAVEASKKMLKNGVLDYHFHAEHIVNILTLCAECYSKTSNHIYAIQYASEALQYNKNDTSALICRAKAFENDKFLLFSYADYMRIPSNDHSYFQVQRAMEKLVTELKTSEGENWRDKLPKDHNDDERYLTYIKIKDNYTDKDSNHWYRSRGNQLYLDACFVLAIQCYTYSIELKPDNASSYNNRAICYLKVFEPHKAMTDCDKALEIDPTNVRALYRKACAYKMLSNNLSYRSTLEDLLKIQPNNQTILSEYYNSQHEQIPRKMRRIRMNNPPDTTPTPSTTTTNSNEIKNPQPPTTMEDNTTNLSYEELEQIRNKKLPQFSENIKYQFTQKLNELKLDDIKSLCSLMLRLPTKGLFKIVSASSPKLIETIVTCSRIMISAEKRYQQEHKSAILPFSYIKFSFDILSELTTLPRIDSSLSMIDSHVRAVLDDLITYYSSIASILNDVDKLNRLRQQTK